MAKSKKTRKINILKRVGRYEKILDMGETDWGLHLNFDGVHIYTVYPDLTSKEKEDDLRTLQALIDALVMMADQVRSQPDYEAEVEE